MKSCKASIGSTTLDKSKQTGYVFIVRDLLGTISCFVYKIIKGRRGVKQPSLYEYSRKFRLKLVFGLPLPRNYCFAWLLCKFSQECICSRRSLISSWLHSVKQILCVFFLNIIFMIIYRHTMFDVCYVFLCLLITWSVNVNYLHNLFHCHLFKTIVWNDKLSIKSLLFRNYKKPQTLWLNVITFTA